LERRIVDLEETEVAERRRVSMHERIDAGAHHHVLLHAALARNAKAVLGIPGAQHPRRRGHAAVAVVLPPPHELLVARPRQVESESIFEDLRFPVEAQMSSPIPRRRERCPVHRIQSHARSYDPRCR